jgi:PKD repeat protein
MFSYVSAPGNNTVSYNPNQSGSSFSFAWDFGDASLDTVQNPTHTFSSTGNFSTCLTLTDTNGICVSDTFCDVIIIYPPCAAGFSHTATADSVSFTDTTTAAGDFILTWDWNFGGTTSNVQNPSHIFSSCGKYPVSLTINTNSGCVSTITDTVQVNTPIAGAFIFNVDTFTGNTIYTASPNNVNFNYAWDFGDGVTGTGSSTAHVFTEAHYLSCVTATDNSGVCMNDTICDSVFVHVYIPCQADFNFSTYSDSIQFSDLSTAPGDVITSWNWSFGDLSSDTLQNASHVYSDCGQYFATLTISTAAGCTSTVSDTVWISKKINGNFIYAANSANGTVNFNATPQDTTFSYAWDFGDSNAGNGMTTQHVYLNGNYTACLITSSPDNFCFADTICSAVAVSFPYCNANFIFTTNGDTVNFTDASTILNDSIVNWSWSFGDTVANPSRVYTCGSQIVTLNISTASNCISSFTDTINVSGSPNASFTYSVDSISGVTTFNALPVGSSFNYSWNFGEGNTGSGNATTNTYTNGNYQACLFLTDTNGNCANDTTCQSVVVNISTPPCDAGYTYSMSGDTVVFTNTSTAVGDSITFYSWNFGDFFPSTQSDPTHIFNGCGTYIVSLVIATQNNCMSNFTDTINISGQINGAFTYTIDTITGVTQFAATPNNSNYSFAWDFGDGGTATNANPSHTYTEGFYTACVIINSSNLFCVADTVCDTLNVSLDSLVCSVSWNNIANGSMQIFTPTPVDFFGGAYTWDFGDGATSNNVISTHTYTSTGLYTVCLTYTNAQGCTTQFCDTVEIPACSINFTYTGTNGNMTFTATTAGGGFFPIVAWLFVNDSATAFGNTVTHQFTSNGVKIVCAVLNPGGFTGCSDTLCQFLYVSGVGIGIEEAAIENSVSLQPNPFNDLLSIQFDLSTNRDIAISIFDVLGNKVDDVTSSKNQNGHQNYMYNSSRLNAGVYFVKIQAGDKIITRKVIKQ